MRILLTKTFQVADAEARLLQNRLKGSFRDRLGKMNRNRQRSPIILPEERQVTSLLPPWFKAHPPQRFD